MKKISIFLLFFATLGIVAYLVTVDEFGSGEGLNLLAWVIFAALSGVYLWRKSKEKISSNNQFSEIVTKETSNE